MIGNIERRFFTFFPFIFRFALKNNLPLLEHCTIPRTGAMEVIMETLGPPANSSSASVRNSPATKSDHNSNGAATSSITTPTAASSSSDDSSHDGTVGNGSITGLTDRITKIVDVTIAYEDGKPLDLGAIMTAMRPPCITHVHYRIFNVEDVSRGCVIGHNKSSWIWRQFQNWLHHCSNICCRFLLTRRT